MNIIPFQELLNLSLKELKNELKKAERELLRFKIGIRTKHLKEIHQIRNFKKYVAQIHTLITEKKAKTTNSVETIEKTSKKSEKD